MAVYWNANYCLILGHTWAVISWLIHEPWSHRRHSGAAATCAEWAERNRASNWTAFLHHPTCYPRKKRTRHNNFYIPAYWSYSDMQNIFVIIMMMGYMYVHTSQYTFSPSNHRNVPTQQWIYIHVSSYMYKLQFLYSQLYCPEGADAKTRL